MGNSVITMTNITKRFKKAEVVKNFSLDVKNGSITGLIGPNGAGKTTIMKILAGLMFQTSGELSFYGSRDDLDLNRRRMSFMIEAPIVDYNMTAYENLNYVRYVRGYPDKKRIDEVLDIVDLKDTGRKKALKFSLGMRQRLGIAMALLTKPEVLVLDEPVNGLDPEGIVEVRHILQKLSEDQGVTILISSHLLSELSELCTDFSIINKGQLVENLSLEELHNRCRSHIVLRTNNTEKTAAVLEDKLSIGSYKVLQSGDIEIYEQLDAVERISKTVTDSGCIITKLYESGQSLEDYYLEKVGGSHE
ncbi:ABC transporter ATP-binding protein [Ruminococcus flavefaciens]|uniref:ABC-2 type transport system ATP-binding protein n=1 Tax=Ruminococcus flavefaciens TaxID=1265 RepID=A0A315Y390_RUMFL|nr:ATP-binding cassette domain-containing protein [Ruminococcus flavefaciens]PWJ14028.1 ABC-2 type transport system ATP-binding protein [Ruminococcus flavefaciens]SSA43654.1 ABC-2 type transport system ATP-binding protein [Ruminococcus flavefaciens]